ncbi:hypothetical protein FACS189472_16890 [Alphaproteobacteria bacterium]|nr:hypothetical protein FACS189472_16890 [Alphaproteobacteria bacterium]
MLLKIHVNMTCAFCSQKADAKEEAREAQQLADALKAENNDLISKLEEKERYLFFSSVVSY